MTQEKLIMAVPKGRILDELLPILSACDIVPEDDFHNEKSRKLKFSTNHAGLEIIRVRAFDVAAFVAYGGAQMGVVGSDALEEFQYPDLYSPLDLGIGACRLSVAMPEGEADRDHLHRSSHVRVATKYPNLTARHYARRGVQAECIKLNGAMEIVPVLGLASRIVDLVSTGGTLKANHLVEVDKIMDVSSRLIVCKTSLKTMPDTITLWIERFQKAIS